MRTLSVMVAVICWLGAIGAGISIAEWGLIEAQSTFWATVGYVGGVCLAFASFGFIGLPVWIFHQYEREPN